MKRTMGMAILGLALAGVPAAGQPAGEEPREPGRKHRGEALAEYLGLTEQQQAQWRALHEQHREAMKPQREEGRALRQRVREALEANEPEVVVGEAVKAAHAHREKARAAREAFEGQLQSLLTPDQKQKYEAFKAARKVGRPGRPGHGPRRGRPHREAPPVEG